MKNNILQSRLPKPLINFCVSATAFFTLAILVTSCNEPVKSAPPTTPAAVASQPDNSIRDKSTNSVKAYIDDIESKLKAIDEGMRGNDFQAVYGHAEEIENIASSIKQESTNFSSSEFELIKRDLSEIQHGGDEIRDAVKSHSHEDIHHAIETVKDHLATLKSDVYKL